MCYYFIFFFFFGDTCQILTIMFLQCDHLNHLHGDSSDDDDALSWSTVSEWHQQLYQHPPAISHTLPTPSSLPLSHWCAERNHHRMALGGSPPNTNSSKVCAGKHPKLLKKKKFRGQVSLRRLFIFKLFSSIILERHECRDSPPELFSFWVFF